MQRIDDVGWYSAKTVYYLPESNVGDRTEIYSLMRDSDLSDADYLARFHDDGREHWQD